MANYYTSERNAQVIISLLKQHGIRKIIASPGTTNMTFVGSVQQDPYFEVYSSVDERSGAYIACGLASETGEPVVLSCTGATASRNYFSGLTEAYYRKLPILAITSTQETAKVGHHIAQIIDRSSLPKDTANLSVVLPLVKDDEDLWNCEIQANRAILELKRRGGGPVHINLETGYSRQYDVKELPTYRKIDRIFPASEFPELPKGKIGIFVGSHSKMNEKLTNTIDSFCEANNAVVFCDHTSGYYGKYKVLSALIGGQLMSNKSETKADLLIHIGEVTGDYCSLGLAGKEVWRVNEDGEIRDTFRKLTNVFEMSEQMFFEHYSNTEQKEDNSYLQLCQSLLESIRSNIPELPFSNIWLASMMAHRIPKGATVHFGILNSLRSWNFYELPDNVTSYSNVGGFGIDGGVSTLVGASFADKDKLYFGIIGDLAFFYDINVLGNRHVGNNLRILLVNNGKGTEFRQFNHVASQFGEDADKFIAAAGHFGNKSPELVKNYAQSLGFEYISASNKDEFEKVYERFLMPILTEKPIIFEVFTNSELESKALETITNVKVDLSGVIKKMAQKILGQSGVNTLKKISRK
ncbi:MAG TPA: thiamine pyrophosphate-binding protein [Salinivirgaceae bacterium]|nr:thiamine pyrophosphate-binding protein [Salinivirgaceae bacterium]